MQKCPELILVKGEDLADYRSDLIKDFMNNLIKIQILMKKIQ